MSLGPKDCMVGKWYRLNTHNFYYYIISPLEPYACDPVSAWGYWKCIVYSQSNDEYHFGPLTIAIFYHNTFEEVRIEDFLTPEEKEKLSEIKIELL